MLYTGSVNIQLRRGHIMTVSEAWDLLIELGVSEQTLQIIASINGYNMTTMQDVLYAHTGYRTFEQLESDDS